MKKVGVSFRLGSFFRLLLANFALIAIPLNMQLLKGQLQTSNGLANDQMTALKALKERLAGPLGRFFNVCKSPILLTQTPAPSRLEYPSAGTTRQYRRINDIIFTLT